MKTGDDVLIGGFIITGSSPKKVMIRATGPSLTLATRLFDTVLDLHLPDRVISNDNWREDQEAEIEATTIAPRHDLESAIVATLEPGAYTAVVRGKDDVTGVGVVEAYDLDSGSPSRLANIAARGLVEKGDNVMIGGFFVSEGMSEARVFIRAIGPSLGKANVSGALQDPVLELHDSFGNLVAENNDWQDAQKNEIEAASLAPTDPRESVIITALKAGGYTAVIRGAGESEGVGLLEIYSVQ